MQHLAYADNCTGLCYIEHALALSLLGFRDVHLKLLTPITVYAVPDAETAQDALDTKEEPQTDDAAEGKGVESEPGSAPADEPPLSEAEAKTSGDEQLGGGASAEEPDDGEEKMDTDD